MSPTPPLPPGVVEPGARRARPKRAYELIACGLRGHALVGTDSARLGHEHALFAREVGDMRWHRCLRCDAWLALPVPDPAARPHPPAREEIELPLRGRPLRDRIVLRVIAVDRALHFVILAALAVALLLFASQRADLRPGFYRLITDLQGGVGGGPVQVSSHGLVHELDRLFTLRSSSLTEVTAAIVVYALLEGTEAVGLWFAKRWAEYLTLVATAMFLPLEVYELAHRFTPLKIVAFAINVAVVIYLLYAKRLFGLRGGGRADEAERERDLGWEAIERASPPPGAPEVRADQRSARLGDAPPPGAPPGT